ncbi:hypothetical protein J1N35_026070 [Gossypium stocksii]|uniref:Zinc knuckle CX2CX4HX4C domain-containing protein n=1 Tax=Gossypium stocksii TaxID=47602 RepID=A0A9D3ZXT1_9ROSI|nr:hypothetical protein J1N35_026070 [Gossypium stocksii]
MAKQFGDFLGQFLEYDMAFRPINYQSFMRIRVRLDVTVPLKQKKKILIGNDRTIYAKFRYEKLSLFCFIYGKLGHGLLLDMGLWRSKPEDEDDPLQMLEGKNVNVGCQILLKFWGRRMRLDPKNYRLALSDRAAGHNEDF